MTIFYMKNRTSVVRERNAWTMSEAEFKSFIISALRDKSRWWKPKTRAIARARVSKWIYKCESCGVEWPANLPPLPWKKRKRKNIQADHIEPVVPLTGFVSYDSWIERCFVSAEKFQAICRKCHKEKTAEEGKKRRELKKGV